MDLLRSWLNRPPEPRRPVQSQAAEEGGGYIKESPIQIDGRCMSAEQFVRYVEGLNFPNGLPTRIFLHHTWRPTSQTWAGLQTLLNMKAYYESLRWTDEDGREHEGWTAGPHLFVAEDGIWLFSDLRQDGVGVAGHNHGSLHLEMVGNFNIGLPQGATLRNTIAALGILHERIGLPPDQLNFHRDYSTKTCPGTYVQKAWIIPQVQRWVAEYRSEKARRNASLRQSLLNLVGELILPANGGTALSKEAEERGLLGPVTHEIPIEIGERSYIVQLYAEALLVPVNEWDQVSNLQEVERAQESDEPASTMAIDADLPVYDVSNPPHNAIRFDGRIR